MGLPFILTLPSLSTSIFQIRRLISIWYPAKLIIKKLIIEKKQLVVTVILCYNFQDEKLVTTHCIYNGLLILDVMVERPSKNDVSFNKNENSLKLFSNLTCLIRIKSKIS